MAAISNAAAAPLCMISPNFHEPTVEWEDGAIVFNGILGLTVEEDRAFFGEVLDLFSEEDYPAAEMWWENIWRRWVGCRQTPAPTAVAAKCNEIPVGARPASTRWASFQSRGISLNGCLFARTELETELEWLGTDGRFAQEADQWYKEYTGNGICSSEREVIGRGWKHPTQRHTGRNRARMERDRARQAARRLKKEVLGC